MNKNKILELLKTINYPGFSRDIVSFGMVDNVSIDGDTINVELKITTQNEDKKTSVINEVNKVLENTNSFTNIKITIQEGAPSSPQPQEPKSQEPPPAAPLDGVRHIIAVASGKGGVGKSTVAANIALGLKNSGHSVGLLDLDIYGPSLPIILGIQEQPELTQDRKLVPLDHLGMKIMSFGFISGNKTPIIWRGPLVARMTEQFFRDVEWGELDYLILDLPPGTGDVHLTLTQKLKVDGVIIVTTPQDIALADVSKGADMFKKVHTPILGVVENMSGLYIEGKADKGSQVTIEGQELILDSDGQFSLRIDVFKRGGGQSESDRLNVPLLGEIPLTQEVMEATDAGEPIISKNPKAHVSKIYQSITEKVMNALN